MRRTWMGWVGALALGLVGCGGGPIQPLPGNVNPDSNLPPPDEHPQASESFWPLTTGSTWTYRITDKDPLKPSFEKKVEVLGQQPIPGSTESAVVVTNVEPTLEERTWEIVSDGVVYRVREEDLKAGVVVRVTSWNPPVVKALAGAKPQGWTHHALSLETERNGTGALLKEKQKDFTWVVEAVNQSVTTPAGTWDNAIKLRRARVDKNDWERIYWLVPGVGKVREEGERTEELIQYDVRP